MVFHKPTWKICARQIGSFPRGSDEHKYLSCHPLEILSLGRFFFLNLKVIVYIYILQHVKKHVRCQRYFGVKFQPYFSQAQGSKRENGPILVGNLTSKVSRFGMLMECSKISKTGATARQSSNRCQGSFLLRLLRLAGEVAVGFCQVDLRICRCLVLVPIVFVDSSLGGGFSPIDKKGLSMWESSPNGWTLKNIWNHHLVQQYVWVFGVSIS